MLDFFLNLDVRTLLVVLFAGNLVSVGLICAFYFMTDAGRDWLNCRPLLLAKSLQGVGFFLMLLRSFIPAVLTVNAGNTLVFAGFYFEATVMLRMLGETHLARLYLLPLTVLGIFGFNFVEFVYPHSSIRVATASTCIFLVFVMPCLRLFISKNSGKFKRCVGLMYLCVLVLLFPRIAAALTTNMSLFTQSYVQTLTFLAIALQLVFSFPAFLLLIKEDTDQIIANMATKDMLTGLANRYSFLDAAQRVFLRGSMNRGSIAVLFMDIDHFKNINDSYGHTFGDKVLAALGRTVRDCLRPNDLSCRYGGEEFVILLQDATVSSAVIVAERIRNLVASLSFSEYPDFHFTLSVGVVDGVPGEGDRDSLDLFIGRADSALYMAKRAGRDRIVEYDPISNFMGDI